MDVPSLINGDIDSVYGGGNINVITNCPIYLSVVKNDFYYNTFVSSGLVRTAARGDFAAIGDEVYYRLLNFFTLTKPLQAKLDSISSSWENRWVIGLQIRIGMGNGVFLDNCKFLFEKDVETFVYYAKYFSNRTKLKPIWFISTDSVNVKQMFSQRFPDVSFSVKDLPMKHTMASSYRNDDPATQRAILDNYLLSRSDVLLTTGWSSFGKMAAGRMSVGRTILITRNDPIRNPPPLVVFNRTLFCSVCNKHAAGLGKEAVEKRLHLDGFGSLGGGLGEGRRALAIVRFRFGRWRSAGRGVFPGDEGEQVLRFIVGGGFGRIGRALKGVGEIGTRFLGKGSGLWERRVRCLRCLAGLAVRCARVLSRLAGFLRVLARSLRGRPLRPSRLRCWQLRGRLLHGHFHGGVHSDPLVVQQNRAQPPQRGASREGHRLGLTDLPIEQHVPLLGEQKQRIHAQSERVGRRRRDGRVGCGARGLHHHFHAARRRLFSTWPRSLPPPRAAPCGAAPRSAA